MENGSGQKNSVFLKSKQVPDEDKDKIKQLKEFIFVQNEDDALDIIGDLKNRSLENYRDRSGVKGDTEGISILQYAAAYTFQPKVLEALVTKCPKLLQVRRTGDYNGLTVLHTLVSKGNLEAVRIVLGSPPKKEKALRKFLLGTESNGSAFEGTVMMGELPLIIAALTFDKDMVDLLLKEYRAKVHHTNSAGDTVFHCLIRYSNLYPEKEKSALDMMKHFHDLMYSIEVGGDDLARQVWMIPNNAGFTALKLAALFSQSKAFNYIFDLKGVYCHLGEHDGLFNLLQYDVTEIDPASSGLLAQQLKKEEQKKKKKQEKNQVGPDKEETQMEQELPHTNANPEGVNKTSKTHKGSYLKRQELEYKDRTLSVLEILCETKKAEQSFEILNDYVMRNVLAEQKWRKYRRWFWGWWLFQLIMMVFLTNLAIYKARVISYYIEPENAGNASGITAAGTEELFVLVMSVISFVFALVLLAFEARRWYKRQHIKIFLLHHNGLYRVLLLALGVSLIIDSLWYWINKGIEGRPTNNYFLIVALLTGWWFMMFFLRPFKKFSYFTVMLQRVLFGDMFRFSSVIALEVVAFSAAMYITFLRSPGQPPEEFKNYTRTILTMFQLMLGLSEIEVLYQAHDPWLAILLFVLYVLLTYALMLNALIALMSNTCSVVSENKEKHWLLQRLSVVLFIEASLPSCWVHKAGKRNDMFGKPRMLTQIKSKAPEDLSKGKKQPAIDAQKELMATRAFHLGRQTRQKSAGTTEKKLADPTAASTPLSPQFTDRTFIELLKSFGIIGESDDNGQKKNSKKTKKQEDKKQEDKKQEDKKQEDKKQEDNKQEENKQEAQQQSKDTSQSLSKSLTLSSDAKLVPRQVGPPKLRRSKSLEISRASRATNYRQQSAAPTSQSPSRPPPPLEVFIVNGTHAPPHGSTSAGTDLHHTL